MDAHFASAHRHSVERTRLCVIIIEILLICRCHKLVVAFVIEYRIAQQIMYVLGSVGLRIGGIKGNGIAVIIHRRHLHRRLAYTVALQAVDELRHAYLNRRMVDTVIYRVIDHGLAVMKLTASVCPVCDGRFQMPVLPIFNEDRVLVREINGFERIFGCIGQVECLGALSLSEERSVTLSRCLYHFVFDREKVHRIFAGGDIRMNSDAFLLKEGLRLVYRLMNGVACGVIRVVDYLCDVVAFQLQYQFQVVAP